MDGEFESETQIRFVMDLLKQVRKGAIGIPRFQRDPSKTWSLDRKLELFRSIREGLPIGSVLIWRSNEKVPTVDRIGKAILESELSGPPFDYLLDGVQRISTLFEPICAEEKRFDDESVDEIVLDLTSGDFCRSQDADSIFQLSLLLDTSALLEWQRRQTGQWLGMLRAASDVVELTDGVVVAFRRYKIPVVTIVTDDLSLVTKTFQRINSQGVQMSEADMVRALAWTDSFDLGELFEQARINLGEWKWGNLDDGLLLDACKWRLNMSLDRSVDRLSRELKAKPEVVDEAVESLIRAIRFLAEYCSINSGKLIPYEKQLLLLAVVFENQSPENLEAGVVLALRQWFWWSTYLGAFAGISGGQLQKMRRYVEAIAGGKDSPWPGLNSTVVSPPARFDFRSVRCKALTLRLAACRPRDLENRTFDANLLADFGNEAIIRPLWRSQHDEGGLGGDPPGARFVAPNVYAYSFRKALLNRPVANPWGGEDFNPSSEWLESHAISDEAWRALEAGDLKGFVVSRTETLVGLERSFLETLGKPPGLGEVRFQPWFK